ncbi:MAG: queuosine precursor transporter [Sphaerochaetaceae bacterium]|nr:queuosine precursor transporter [Sphaerochaetaceae bacterium]
MNELLWILMLVLNFGAIMFAFRKWGKVGLMVWVPISVIIANIQVTKTIELFGMEATLGNIVYATSFLATDILSEFYSDKEAKKSIKFGFFSLIIMTVMMQMALFFKPAPSDMVQSSLRTVFSLMPRIVAGSLLAFFLSSYHDIWAYRHWKNLNKPLFLRNNLSTLVSQLIDTTVFSLIAFYGVFTGKVLLEIMFSTLVFKWIVAICDTPMIYLARKWVSDGKIKEISIN